MKKKLLNIDESLVYLRVVLYMIKVLGRNTVASYSDSCIKHNV